MRGAGIGLKAASRPRTFVESGRTSLALRLSIGGASYLRVLARWTLGVSATLKIGTAYCQEAQQCVKMSCSFTTAYTTDQSLFKRCES